MALAPLASTTDLSERGITTGSLATALEVASAAIRDAAGVSIGSHVATLAVNAGSGNLLPLPSPVTAVTSVVRDGVEVTDYEILPNGLWRRCGWGSCHERVEVTGTFGLATVPADIVDLTCVLAKTWLDHVADGGGSTAGLRSAQLDDASESYTEEAAAQLTPVFIPEATRRWLAARFSGGVAVVETL